MAIEPLAQLHPGWPLAGGLLIGLSAAFYLLFNGRIAGVSGIVAAATGLSAGSPRPLGLAFVAGILGGGALAMAFIRSPDVVVTSSPIMLVAAGLLVGFGSRLGSGCTSGHGVCGLARLSLRSLVATAAFMLVAVVVVFVRRRWGF